MYLLEANIYVIIFFAFYKFLLHKETFHSMNRYFLILSSGLAFLLPLVKLGNLNSVQQGEVDIFYPVSAMETRAFTLENALTFFYILVVLIGLFRLSLKLFQLYRLIRSGVVYKIGDINLVQSANSLPFSFFNYLFLNPDAEKRNVILRHESVHIQQWHSADILLFELMAIISWFNPFIYLMQREIKVIHEYLADEQASKEELALDEYASFLIRNSCPISNAYLANQMFNRSLLKKRIIMLSKKKSSPASRLKYGLMIMVIPLLVCASSMALTKSYGIDLASGSALLRDTSNKPKEKALQPAKSSGTKKDLWEPRVEVVKFTAKSIQPQKSASKKKYPEPKVEKVTFTAKDQQPGKTEKKKYPEPKVEQVKFPPVKDRASAIKAEGKNLPAVKKLPPPLVERVKTTPPPKVEQAKLPPPPKVAKPATPPVEQPEVEKVPPPPPPAQRVD